MKLFDKADENAEAVRNAGRWAIAQAQARGLPVHYIDAATGAGIIEERADGTQRLLDSDTSTSGSKASVAVSRRRRQY